MTEDPRFVRPNPPLQSGQFGPSTRGRGRETDWQVGAVLKDKPGSQGTLFRGGTKWSSDERFPKHYNPERLHEVADAVVTPSHRSQPPLPGMGVPGTKFKGYATSTYDRGVDSAYYGDRQVRTGIEMDSPTKNQSNKTNRDLVDTVARSTVPVHHLETRDHDPVGGNPQHVSFLPNQRLTDANGEYWKGGAGNKPQILLSPERESTSTVIHEIGHHVSHSYGTHPGYDTPEQRGQEESTADNYMDKHYRDRSGRQARESRQYAGGWTSDTRPQSFYDSYNKVRDRSLGKAAHAEEVRKDPQQWGADDPETHEHPDGSRDVAFLHKDWDYDTYHDPKTGAEHPDTSAVHMTVNHEALPAGTFHESALYDSDQKWLTEPKVKGTRVLPVQREQFGY